MTMLELFLRAVEREVCRRWDHRWLPFMLHGQRDPRMRYAVRDYCGRCGANRLRWTETHGGPFTGEVDVFSAEQVSRLAPGWLEALYRARWREYPRQRVVVGGAFPAEWRWAE